MSASSKQIKHLTVPQREALRKHPAFVEHWPAFVAEFNIEPATVRQGVYAGASALVCAEHAMQLLTEGEYSLDRFIAAIKKERAPILLCAEHGLVGTVAWCANSTACAREVHPISCITDQSATVAASYTHAPLSTVQPVASAGPVVHGYAHLAAVAARPPPPADLNSPAFCGAILAQSWFVANWDAIARKAQIDPDSIRYQLPAGSSPYDAAEKLLARLRGLVTSPAQLLAWKREFTNEPDAELLEQPRGAARCPGSY